MKGRRDVRRLDFFPADAHLLDALEHLSLMRVGRISMCLSLVEELLDSQPVDSKWGKGSFGGVAALAQRRAAAGPSLAGRAAAPGGA